MSDSAKSNDGSESEAADSAQTRPADSPENQLPEVKPPTSKFLIQLFLAPLLIVLGAVSFVLIPQFLAGWHGDPRTYVEELQRPSDAAWQSAWNLAEALHDRRNDELKSDPQFAAQLSRLLEDQLAATGQLDEKEVWLRSFLCRAIGTLKTPEALPVLLKAANQDETPEDQQVRLAAVEALSEAIDHLGAQSLRENDAIWETLLTASNARSDSSLPFAQRYEDQLRSRACFALGVLGGDRATNRLAELTSDALSDVRYNAATGLARQGDLRATPVLLEMLDPAVLPEKELVVPTEILDTISDDDLRTRQRVQQASIMNNAIRAVVILAHENAHLDREPVLRQLDAMLQSEIPLQLRDVASEAKIVLESPPGS
ncbi:MAG: HEAT repeat domain-containing protein [Blastopirellula sp. JB062]